MLRYKTDRTWISCLVWLPAWKWKGSILTTLEPARDKQTDGWASQHWTQFWL